jgi:hypothetical protein
VAVGVPAKRRIRAEGGGRKRLTEVAPKNWTGS